MPSFLSLPASRVVLGLDAAARDALVERLIPLDRDAFDDARSLRFRAYDEPARRAEIRAALASALGHAVIDVAAFDIQARCVTNAMWRAFVLATGAAPALVPGEDDASVAGVSPAEASAFAAHHGWSLPSEAEWQHAAARGALTDLHGVEYTRDPFAPYPGGAGGDPTKRSGRGCAPGTPPCIEGRFGTAEDHRFALARFRCVRR